MTPITLSDPLTGVVWPIYPPKMPILTPKMTHFTTVLTGKYPQNDPPTPPAWPPLGGGTPGTPIFDPFRTPFLLEFPYETAKKGGQKPPKKGQKWSILGQKLTFSPGVPRETRKNVIFHREILMVFSLFAKIVGLAPPLFDPPGPPWPPPDPLFDPFYHCFNRKWPPKRPNLPLFWQENDPQNDPFDP